MQDSSLDRPPCLLEGLLGEELCIEEPEVEEAVHQLQVEDSTRSCLYSIKWTLDLSKNKAVLLPNQLECVLKGMCPVVSAEEL